MRGKRERKEPSAVPFWSPQRRGSGGFRNSVGLPWAPVAMVMEVALETPSSLIENKSLLKTVCAAQSCLTLRPHEL